MEHALEDGGGDGSHFEGQHESENIHHEVEHRADDPPGVALPKAVSEEGDKADVYGHGGTVSSLEWQVSSSS